MHDVSQGVLGRVEANNADSMLTRQFLASTPHMFDTKEELKTSITIGCLSFVQASLESFRSVL